MEHGVFPVRTLTSWKRLYWREQVEEGSCGDAAVLALDLRAA